MNRRQFLAVAGGAVTAAGPSRPNVLLVMTDQQSADCMSSRMGSRHLRTPAMDSLAAVGMTFSRAYCANPVCVPSRNSMFTGRYPVETGLQVNKDKGSVSLDPARFPTLGCIMRAAGYATGYFGKWHLAFPSRQAETHGFEETRVEGRDPGIAAAASEFLKRTRAKPFFAVVSFYNPHNICEWPRKEPLPDGEIGSPPPLTECPPLPANHLPQKDEPDIIATMRRSYQSTPAFPVGHYGEREWREYLWAYYRMIEKVDGLIGQVLNALRVAGQWNNTVVVFVSDHGDCQGAHGWNQKTVLYDEAARVPLVIAFPGVTKPGLSDRLVHTGIDLIPTVCDYAGVRPPAGLTGRSLRGTANGEDLMDPREFLVVSNKMRQGLAASPVPEGRMVRTARFKYCAYSHGRQRESLVDMLEDPGEMVNLARDACYREELERHRRLLSGWQQAVGDRPFPES